MTEFHPTDDEEKEEEDDNTTAQEFSDLSKETEAVVSDQEQPQGVGTEIESRVQSHNESRDLAGDEKKREVSGGLDEGGKEELKKEGEGESMSTEDVQQSLDNIFSLLKIDKPLSSSDTTPPIDFNEFTKMLTDPSPAQAQSLGEEGGGPLTSTEKSLALSAGPKSDEFVSLAPRLRENKKSASPSTGTADDNSEIVNATGAPTPAEHLELLKEKIPPVENDEVPLLSDLGVTDESIAESLAEQKRKEEAEQTPWPDIGQPEAEFNFLKDDEKVEEEKEASPQLQMNNGAGAAPPTSQWAASSKGETPVISGLTMPSADVAIDMTGVKAVEEPRDVPEQSHDQGNLSERDVTPSPPDQEGQEEEEEGLGQEVGGETLPTELVPKPKKKSRRGTKGKAKKTTTGATLSAAGVVEQG